MTKQITRKLVNEYLKRGVHVHIRVDDGNGNKQIVETIFLVGIPRDQICTEIHKRVDFRLGDVVVASRAFLSPKDKPNKNVPNEVIVGRMIRKIEEGRISSFDKEIRLCGGISAFQKWLTRGLPPIRRDVPKIAVFKFKDPDYMEEAKQEIMIYKEHVESTRVITDWTDKTEG